MIDDTQITNPDIARDIEQKLFGLRKAVDHLQKSVDRYKPSLISDRFPDRMQQQLNKVAYPFRKDILRDMVQDLDSLQIFIQTTLQMYVPD
jgi:hypothetical protein